MEEEEQEFEVYRGSSHSRARLCEHHQIFQECTVIQNKLVTQELKLSIKEFTDMCQAELQADKKGLIFPLQLRKNQEKDLTQFINLLKIEIEQKHQDIFRSILKEENDKYSIKEFPLTEVRQIVLNMYIQLEQHPQFKVIVFLFNQVTDLSEINLYCFQKGLKNKQFVAIVPTFETFDNDLDAVTQLNYQKLHLQLYKPKQLFCRYMYQCITKQEIKAYLPQQIIGLITDIDYYSLSYRQSCRRFVFCLERSLILSRQDREWVQFQHIVDLIENQIQYKFKYYNGYQRNIQKLLKIILIEKQSYIIPEKALAFELAMLITAGKQTDQDIWINSLRQGLTKQLNKNQKWQQYSKYLQEKEEQLIIRKHKKTRSDQLGIDTKKNITCKNKLQNQITKILKHATASIRAQGALIRWADIKFQLRIKPQIPYLIFDVLRKDQETSQFVEEITNTFSAPLAKYLAMFPDDIGRTIYIMKSLQMAGLIQISKKHVRPIVYNCYFEKAQFSGNHR